MEKKLFLTSMMISISSLAFSQVGINTPTPTSTLDITAKNATGTTGNVDGLLIPRVTRERAQSMANVPISTLIYVYEVTTGTQTLTAVNIDSVGHYFFNGTVWVKLNTSAGAPLSTNIYNSDGTLNSNRVVTQGTNKLQFNSSTENGLFTIDAANNRIGVGGVTAPDGLVEIVADNKGSAAGNDFYFTGYGDSSNPALFISSSGGTRSAPTALAPNTRIGSLYFNPRLSGGWPFTSSAVSAFYKGDGTTNLTNLSFTTSTAERMIIDENGKVGIGTSTPTDILDVAGTTRVRTMTQVATGTAVTPVYSDANGVLVKASPSAVYQEVTSSSSPSTPSGGSGTLANLSGAFYYKATVIVTSSCGYTAMADFYIIGNTAGGAINAMGGVAAGGSSSKPTFTQTGGSNVIGVSWTGMTVCADGGDSTAYNYTLTITGSNTLTITNNGNTSKSYFLILTKLT